MDKRQPLLFDRYVAQKPLEYYTRKFQEVMRDRVLDSSKFVLTKEASDYFADMVREIPEAIAYGQEFAISPHTRMWIEIPHYDEFWRRITGREPEEYCDESVAYFIDGPRAYVFAGARFDGRPAHPVAGNWVYPMPIEYRLNQPFTPEQEIEVCKRLQTTRLQIDAFFWGTSIGKVAELNLNQPWTEETVIGRQTLIAGTPTKLTG